MSRLITRCKIGPSLRWGEILGTPPALPTDEVEVAPFDLQATSTSELLDALDRRVEAKQQPVTVAGASIVAPITPDCQILCQGLNYRDHAAEARLHVRSTNLIFSKASSSLAGPFDNVVRPPDCQLLDYEIEFGLVMRKPINADVLVTEQNIGEYVAGLILANDVSARDIMFGAPYMQWFFGKSARTFCPVGPAIWFLEPDEVADALSNVEIELALNGERRQQAQSTALIFKPVETINHVARAIDLRRGNLLLTGTPGGITSGGSIRLIEILKERLLDDDRRLSELREEWAKPRPFMRPGDVCSGAMRDLRSGASLGGIRNPIV